MIFININFNSQSNDLSQASKYIKIAFKLTSIVTILANIALFRWTHFSSIKSYLRVLSQYLLVLNRWIHPISLKLFVLDPMTTNPKCVSKWLKFIWGQKYNVSVIHPFIFAIFQTEYLATDIFWKIENNWLDNSMILAHSDIQSFTFRFQNEIQIKFFNFVISVSLLSKPSKQFSTITDQFFCKKKKALNLCLHFLCQLFVYHFGHFCSVRYLLSTYKYTIYNTQCFIPIGFLFNNTLSTRTILIESVNDIPIQWLNSKETKNLWLYLFWEMRI